MCMKAFFEKNENLVICLHIRVSEVKLISNFIWFAFSDVYSNRYLKLMETLTCNVALLHILKLVISRYLL